MSNIKQYIHEHVKEIWKNEIPTDYENCHLLKEDSLKNEYLEIENNLWYNAIM